MFIYHIKKWTFSYYKRYLKEIKKKLLILPILIFFYKKKTKIIIILLDSLEHRSIYFTLLLIIFN